MDTANDDSEIYLRVIDSLKRQIYETKRLIKEQKVINKGEDLIFKRKIDQCKARLAVKSLKLKKQKQDAADFLEESQKQWSLDYQQCLNTIQTVKAARLQSRYLFTKELIKLYSSLGAEPLLFKNLKEGSKLRQAIDIAQLERTLTNESEELQQVTTVIDNDYLPEYTTEYIQSVMKGQSPKSDNDRIETQSNLEGIRALIKSYVTRSKKDNILDTEEKNYLENLKKAEDKQIEFSTEKTIEKLTESSLDEKTKEITQNLFFLPKFEAVYSRRQRKYSEDSLRSCQESKSFIDEISVIDKSEVERPFISGDLYDSSSQDNSSIDFMANNSASVIDRGSFFTFQDESKRSSIEIKPEECKFSSINSVKPQKKKKSLKYYICCCFITKIV
ncbi:unnamed protein product [Blepharisma stoltei]|uniref:Uncharacterized protein n=1 Tax=Blepharisma stoltei TaxID=1481888 RepID=A0AAU9J5C1_9CILI|nr:unnamed protein product [Blepharisma stoltei]